MEWLVTGEGEMLKVLTPKKIDEKKRDEDEPLEAEQTFFSSNLSVLLRAKEMTPANLASLIALSPETITQYLDQQRGPSLAVLVRLRRLWDVSIDALLFEDFSNPEHMESNLNELAKTQAETQKTLEAILKKITELEEDNRKIKKRVGMEDGGGEKEEINNQ